MKFNELPKQIFMLPLLLHWLYLFILGEQASQNEKKKPMKQHRQQHENLLWQFIQLNIHLLTAPCKKHLQFFPRCCSMFWQYLFDVYAWFANFSDMFGPIRIRSDLLDLGL